MQTFLSRADRWSLAFIIPAVVALAACGDEPVAPKATALSTANAGVKGLVPTEVLVTNTSGGTDVGSLRWAADQLTQPGGVIKFDAALAGKTITLDAGLELRSVVEIIAPTGGVTISGKDQFRIITSAGQLSLTNVSITKGYADYGAAIVAGTVELHHSTVYGNRSPISAIYANNLALHQSTVSGNNVGRAAVEYNAASYTVAIQNSTIAFNAPGAGLGPNGRPATDQAVHLINAIVSNNGSPLQNCTSSFGFIYWGDNISNDWTCGEVGIRVVDPKLFPLANNGGPSMTHAISHLGPAFNSTTTWQWCLETDQRYVPRDAKCDVGAFEFNDWTKVTLTIDPNVKVDATNGRAVMTGTVTCTRPETFQLALELHQQQKVGKQMVDVHAAALPTVNCTTTPTTWTSKMILTDGAWQNGSAQATAQTYQTAEWITPASVAGAVKVVVSRR